MSEKPRAAVIGLGSAGVRTLEALRKSGRAQLVAIGDRDPALAEPIAHETGIAAYTDNRSLLAETHPDVVFLCIPPMGVPDLLATCAERGIHVWKELPLARNLAEGMEMVRLAEQANIKLAVGTQRRFADGYRLTAEALGRVGEIFLVRSEYLFNWGPQLDWRGDASSAGGGALLELGYHHVDLLIWLLGLPEEIYGFSASGHRPERLGPAGEDLPAYDTDDTALAVFRYGSQRVANLTVTRRSGPLAERCTIHGRRGSIHANSEQFRLCDPDGNLIEQTEAPPDALGPYQRQLEAFLAAVASSSRLYQCSARENLLNLAVIDAIYLSSRTFQPESPMRLLQTHELDVQKCLANRPRAAAPQPIDAAAEAADR